MPLCTLLRLCPCLQAEEISQQAPELIERLPKALRRAVANNKVRLQRAESCSLLPARHSVNVCQELCIAKD